MNYYLYSKQLNPDIVEYITGHKNITHERLSVTLIAKKLTDKSITFHFNDFYDKYLPMVSKFKWDLLSKVQRMEHFETFIDVNEHNDEEGNNFGIISKEGYLYEPKDFIEYRRLNNEGVRLNIKRKKEEKL